MRPIYLVLDTGHLKDPQQYHNWPLAVADFHERIQDGDKVRLVTWVSADQVEDETPAALEAAAKIFFKDCGEFDDIPQWAFNTDAHDDWQRANTWSRVEARRERNHYSALRANL